MTEGTASTGTGQAELVLTPRAEAETFQGCTESLTRSESDPNLLTVVFTLTPQDIVGSLAKSFDTPPSEVGIVSVGDQTRSAVSGSMPRSSAGPRMTVTAVANHENFSRLVTVIDLHLQEMSGQPTVYFGSLGSLFDHGTLRSVFRVLHILTSGVREAGATAQFFLDPDIVTPSTVKTIEPLFDVTRDEHADDTPSDGPTHSSQEEFDCILDTPILQWLVGYLRDQPGPVSFRRLADQIVQQGVQVDGRQEADSAQIHLLLYHKYVPKLVESGLVVADENHEFVETTRTADWVAGDGTVFSSETASES